MVLELLVLALAIPAGLLIARFTKEELKPGKKYFKPLIILAVLATIWFYLTKLPAEALTSAFIAITTFISLMKSDKKL